MLNNWLLHDSIVLVDAPRLVDTVTDLQMDHPVDPLLNATITFLQNAAEEMKPAVQP